jgi:signal transduction histidine kinase/CheY-like chemotaxis protein/HPt (histidine-containing phosphotransfer) domain-containing protein
MIGAGEFFVDTIMHSLEHRKKRQHATGGKRLWGFVTLLCMTFVTFILSYPAHAQETNSYGVLLGLKDENKQIALGSYAYVTPDPDRRLNYKTLVENHLAGQRGILMKSNVIPLGSSGSSYWIVFSLYNQSQTQDWVLSLGDVLDGRVGTVTDLFIFDHIGQTSMVNTLSHKGNKSDLKIQTSNLNLRIPQGKQAMIVLYAVPQAGLPVTIAPTIQPYKTWIERIGNPFDMTTMIVLSIAIVTGFFLAAALLRRSLGSFFLAVYGLNTLFLFVQMNGSAWVSMPFGVEIRDASFGISAILLLAATRVFFNSEVLRERKILSFLIAMVFVSTALSVSLLPKDSFLYAFLLFAPIIVSFLYIAAISALYAKDRMAGAISFTIATVILVVGLMITIVAISGYISTNAIMVCAAWLCFLPQMILLVASTRSVLTQDDAQRDNASQNSEEDINALANLRRSREASENTRLLKMIDHERQVMNELREREVKRSEEMHRAKDMADEANRSKSAFLAVVSHEIRTPMTGILGMTRLLLETQMSKDQTDYARTIQESGDAMMSLLNDILDFEKIESGKMDLELITFDLHRLIQGLVMLMSGHATAKKITLKADIDPNLPRYVVGDPVRLRQVLLNLAGNSIKFTTDGGVTLQVRSESAVTSGGAMRIRFSVVDTGMGISKEAQKNLFNPFSQADSSVARKFGGTGLGLAISQRLINAMGGRIEIDSTEGEGSTFFFTINASIGNAEDAVSGISKPRLQQEQQGRILTILVVEDNEINRKLFKELVGRMNHEVVLAESGEEALEVVQKRKFDLILMDVQLPGLSGMGATRAIRSMPDRKIASTPIIALTGNTRAEEIRECYAANMNGHVEKPVDPQKLAKIIDRAAKGEFDNPIIVGEVSASEAPKVQTVHLAAAPTQSNAPSLSLETAAPSVLAKKKDIPLAKLVAMSEDDGQAPIFNLADGELDEDSFDTAAKQDMQGASDQDIFDQTMLASLKTGLPPDQLKEMVGSLFENMDAILESMQVGVMQNDAPSLAARAHEMKGMAGNFGLTQLSAIAATLEKTAKAGETPALSGLVSSLQQSAAQSRQVLTAWMEKP